jgi:hypothetical protein
VSVWSILLLLYPLPAIIALCKRRQNTGAIVAVNLVLGWTFIGWFVAFIWSLTYAPRERRLAR